MNGKIVSSTLLFVLCISLFFSLSPASVGTHQSGSTSATGEGSAFAGNPILPTSFPSVSGSWPMFHNDLKRAGCSSSNAPGTNQTRWFFATGGEVYSSPVISNGEAYFGSDDGKVYAVDAVTGVPLWIYVTGGQVRSSPAFYNNTLYVGSYDGYIYSLNASNGLLNWKHFTGGAVFSSAAVDGNVVFDGSGNRVYALNASGGSEIWSYNASGEVDSSPALAGGFVYVGSMDKNVYCLNASTGTRVWNYTTGGGVLSSPAVSDGRVYVGSDDGGVYCLNGSDGSPMWKFDTGANVRCSPAVGYGKVFVGDGFGTFYALDATTNSSAWNYTTGGEIRSSPAVADGKVYVGSGDNRLYAFDESYGMLLWSYGTNGTVRSSPAVADGSIYVGSDDGSVYAFGWVMVPDNYPTIQAAVNAANAGDTIFVRNGTYYECVVAYKSGLHILGESRYGTIVDATDLPSNYTAVFAVCADSVEISGFTLHSNEVFTAICVVDSSCIYCSISDNTADSSTRKGIVSYANNTSIFDNVVNSFGAGIILNGSSFNIVDGNIVSGSPNGISLVNSEGNVVSNNGIELNSAGIMLAAVRETRIYHNNFVNNTSQVVVDATSESNMWDDGCPSGGNYWGGYSGADAMQGQYQNVPGSDGIRDAPYYIDLNNTDRYPLVCASYPEVRVVSVTPMPSFGSSIVPVSVVVENTGSQSKALNVTVYANGVASGQTAITVPAHANVTCLVNERVQTNGVPLSKDFTVNVRTCPAVVSFAARDAIPTAIFPSADTTMIRVFVDAPRGGYERALVQLTDQYANPLSAKRWTNPPAPAVFTVDPWVNYYVHVWYIDRNSFQGSYTIVYSDFCHTPYCFGLPPNYCWDVHFRLFTREHGLPWGISELPTDGGCYVIVGGQDVEYKGATHDVNTECVQAYMALRDSEVKKSQICFLPQDNHSPQDVDGDGLYENEYYASHENLRMVIKDWLPRHDLFGKRVLLYLVGIGAKLDSGDYCFFMRNGIEKPTVVTASELDSWLDQLEYDTGCFVQVIIDADYSGGWIPQLSESARVIISSTDSVSTVERQLFSEYGFSRVFWNEVRSGHCLLECFNRAAQSLQISSGSKWPLAIWVQNPLLDDNGDGQGGDFMAVLGAASQPDPYCEGHLSSLIYVARCEWPHPWFRQVMQGPSYSWPPSNVTLWAKVENETSLANVTARMLPPDFSPNSTIIESFMMADPDHDGNWTVTIPAVNFTNHASGPSNFTFCITAQETNGNMASQSMVNIQFTSDGNPLPDIAEPFIFVERPIENTVVCGTIKVNGTVSDDVCVDRVELYANAILQGTTLLQPASTSYFELSLNTTALPNENNTILVKAYDKSGNTFNETITYFVQNFIHDTAVVDIATNKTIIGRGYSSDIDVTVTNIGSYQESFSLSLYANATCIATTPVTLSSQNFNTSTLDGSTTNLTYGNYVLTGYTSIVSGEGSTANNVLTQIDIIVTIPGDVNGDFTVNILDAIVLGNHFLEAPSSAGWNQGGNNADINGDYVVNILDAIIIGNHFLQHYP